jgi:hypothetical protein
LYKTLLSQLSEVGISSDFIESFAYNYELVTPNAWEKTRNDKTGLDLKTVYFLPTLDDLKDGSQSSNVTAFSNYLYELQLLGSKDEHVLHTKYGKGISKLRKFKQLVIFIPNEAIKFTTRILSKLGGDVELFFIIDQSVEDIGQVIISVLQKQTSNRKCTFILDIGLSERQDFYGDIFNTKEYYGKKLKFNDKVERAAFDH